MKATALKIGDARLDLASSGKQDAHVVNDMACVSLGGLFLQWPIGYVSDKIDRLYALIGLGAGTLAVAAALHMVGRHTPFMLLALVFGAFGGLAESLYAVAVAHANDRPESVDYVALSLTLKQHKFFVSAERGSITGFTMDR